MVTGFRPLAMIFNSAPVPTAATSSPHTVPMSESSTDSVNTWRISLQPPAPSDTRSAISRCRVAPRASNRLATLVHARSNSSPTTAISTSSGCAKRSRILESPVPAGAISNVAARRNRSAGPTSVCRHSASVSVRARSIDTPGRSRPTSV